MRTKPLETKRSVRGPRGRPRASEARSTRSIRFSEKEEMVLAQLALEFTDGDVSKWVRVASINFRPSSELAQALKVL